MHFMESIFSRVVLPVHYDARNSQSERVLDSVEASVGIASG